MMRLLATLLLLTCASNLRGKSAKFRIEKMNYIYEKALQHVHDQKKFNKLESELSGFDRIYMDKKERAASGKEKKEDIAIVNRKLRNLLEEHGLERVLDVFEKIKKVAYSRRKKNKKKAAKEISEGASKNFSAVSFGDPKLQKLWAAAQTSKFARYELEELYSELLELEKKHETLQEALADLNPAHHENSVHAEHNSHLVAEEKNKKAKEANRAVNSHYDELHRKVMNEEFSPFQNAKVKKLWQTARTHSNFTDTDLDTIREELVHFDKQLKKLELHKDELEKLRESGGAKKEGKTTLEQLENGELEAKHERLDRKLKKLEKYLITKIRHSEL